MRRKLRNDVLPELLAPMTRMLRSMFREIIVLEEIRHAYLKGVGSFRLRTLLGLLIVLTALLA